MYVLITFNPPKKSFLFSFPKVGFEYFKIRYGKNKLVNNFNQNFTATTNESRNIDDKRYLSGRKRN